MNYIKRLEMENAEMREQLKQIQDSCTASMGYLASPKFQGPDNNWVNAEEMATRFREIRMESL